LICSAINRKGFRPEPDPSQRPDPFDRHSSARDKQQQPAAAARSAKGVQFNAMQRRRGRPSYLRSPDDTPMRDGNRDRLIGLLTERAARTLLVYLGETNPTVAHWLHTFIKEHPIPIQGNWDEVSGEVFLRKMLSQLPQDAKMELGRDSLFDNMASQTVDPRHMAQRIMDIRVQLSREFIQDLSGVADENQVLLRETLQSSLDNVLAKEPIKNLPPAPKKQVFVHPELLTLEGELHPEVAKSHPELLRAVSPSPAPKRSPTPAPAPGAPKPQPAAPAAAAAAAPPAASAPKAAAPVGPEASSPKAVPVQQQQQQPAVAAKAEQVEASSKPAVVEAKGAETVPKPAVAAPGTMAPAAPASLAVQPVTTAAAAPEAKKPRGKKGSDTTAAAAASEAPDATSDTKPKKASSSKAKSVKSEAAGTAAAAAPAQAEGAASSSGTKPVASSNGNGSGAHHPNGNGASGSKGGNGAAAVDAPMTMPQPHAPEQCGPEGCT